MNAKQRLDNAMFSVENRCSELLRAAFDTAEDSPDYKIRNILTKARQYADAMRSLARVSRSK